MITAEPVRETIKLYQKHGWVLRRINAPSGVINELGEGLEGVLISESDFGCAWFSRPPARGEIAWELRYLGEPPYALVEHIDENSPEFGSQLRAVEGRLREIIAARRTA
ncbi:MAG: hypothetical protein JO053_12810 [Acidobacteria bacterium]|nr:hypothetical protein [Acidobacteriota bacterium]